MPLMCMDAMASNMVLKCFHWHTQLPIKCDQGVLVLSLIQLYHLRSSSPSFDIHMLSLLRKSSRSSFSVLQFI